MFVCQKTISDLHIIWLMWEKQNKNKNKNCGLHTHLWSVVVCNRTQPRSHCTQCSRPNEISATDNGRSSRLLAEIRCRRNDPALWSIRIFHHVSATQKNKQNSRIRQIYYFVRTWILWNVNCVCVCEAMLDIYPIPITHTTTKCVM